MRKQFENVNKISWAWVSKDNRRRVTSWIEAQSKTYKYVLG